MRIATEIAYIALGSNLGDSIRVVREAMSRLAVLSAVPLIKSSLWETTPIDCPPGSPFFINAVVGLMPHDHDEPQMLLAPLQAIEREFGRQPKKVLNEARLLDLDIIAFGERAISTPQLILPHPRAHVRAFVLAPLSEIAPDLVLPGQTRSVSMLLNDLLKSCNNRAKQAVSIIDVP